MYFKIFVLLLLLTDFLVAGDGVDYLKCVYLSRLAPCVESRYRNIDGTCNNLKDKNFGKAYWPYQRLLPPTYSDGKHDLPVETDNTPYPSARIISNLVFPPGDPPSKEYSLAFMSILQLIAHDMGLAEGTQAGSGGNSNPPGCCTNFKFGPDSTKGKCAADIVIPPNDPAYGDSGVQCLAFGRTSTTSRYLCYLTDFDEQINLATSYVDASFVYGNLPYPALNLRSYSGGRLKSEERFGQEFPPQEPNPKSICPGVKAKDDTCYLTGDVRANQNPPLTTMQIMLLSSHNTLADQLAALNPDWCDDFIYQETRRLLIALWQHTVYDFILPELLGQETIDKYGLNNPNPGTYLNDYNPNVDASTNNEFATGSYRYFHTLIPSMIETYDSNKQLLATFNISDFIDRGEADELNDKINYFTLAEGLTIQPAAETDQFYASEIKSKFAKNDLLNLGIDLISFDIKRSQDHAVARYMEVRRFCNLSVATSFDDLEDIDPTIREKFKKIYPNVDSIELITGGHLETHKPGSLVGPTHACVIALQFQKSRIGDRYFFENTEIGKFTPEQLASIKNTPVAALFCQNTNMKKIPKDVLKVVGPDNPLVSCDEIIAQLDLEPWRNLTVPAQESLGYLGQLGAQTIDKLLTLIQLLLPFK